jgi:KaiC/GvpD/RAD55 family RecA-like ATPase
MIKASVRTLESKMSKKQNKISDEDMDSKAMERKIHELTRALEHAQLKISSLETLIKVSEEDLQIKIRKKRGTKQSKE